MNLYTCTIDLRHDARALNFAKALGDWLDHLQNAGTIRNWQLYRRKLNLASDKYRDFLLMIEVEDMTQLDAAFRMLGSHDEAVDAMYRAVHDHIQAADFGLFRPFPDPERAERMAMI